MYDSIQNYFAKILVLKDCDLCVSLWVGSITQIFFHIFVKKGDHHDLVWYMMNISEDYKIASKI